MLHLNSVCNTDNRKLHCKLTKIYTILHIGNIHINKTNGLKFPICRLTNLKHRKKQRHKQQFKLSVRLEKPHSQAKDDPFVHHASLKQKEFVHFGQESISVPSENWGCINSSSHYKVGQGNFGIIICLNCYISFS